MYFYVFFKIFIPPYPFAWLINAINADRSWVKSKRQKEHTITAELRDLRTLLPRENEAIDPKRADKFVLWIVEAQKYF